MRDSLTLQISGMSCQHCVQAVRRALETIEGVDIETVEIGRAEVQFDPGTTDVSRITDAVEDAGYSAVPAL